MSVDLSVQLGKLTLKNPIMPASGTFGYGEEFSEFFNLSLLGAIVTKGISLRPKVGNPSPRIYEGNGYIINSIGLENVGFDKFLDKKVPFLKSFDTVKIVNFFGNTEEEYCILSEKLNKIEEIDAIEVNVSCPNVKKGGIEFGLNIDNLFTLVEDISKIADKKIVMVKLSPLISDIALFGSAVEEAGADAITISNTLRGLNIDIINKNFSVGNISGGISGPVLKSVSLKLIYELKKVVKIPIIGVGGIFNFKDAIEYFMCGATAVQVGTANFINPFTMIDIINDLKEYMHENHISSIGEFCIC